MAFEKRWGRMPEMVGYRSHRNQEEAICNRQIEHQGPMLRRMGLQSISRRALERLRFQSDFFSSGLSSEGIVLWEPTSKHLENPGFCTIPVRQDSHKGRRASVKVRTWIKREASVFLGSHQFRKRMGKTALIDWKTCRQKSSWNKQKISILITQLFQAFKFPFQSLRFLAPKILMQSRTRTEHRYYYVKHFVRYTFSWVGNC